MSDLVTCHREAMEVSIDAFAAADLLSRTMYLAEMRRGMALPARAAMGFHLVDYVVHSWDAAA